MKTNHRWMLAALCLLASAHSYAQTNMELTQKQQALAAIAAHEAKGEIVTIAAIAALPGCEPQLRAHVSGARHMGVSQQQLQQLPAVLRARVGEAVAAVFGLPAEAAAPAYLSVWPRGEKNPYGQYFIGQSYLADLGAVMNVTFEPRCRNNWHVHLKVYTYTHHVDVSVVICLL